MAQTEIREFVDYVYDYYGKGGIFEMGVTKTEILEALAVYLLKGETPFEGDTVDREKIRDIMRPYLGAEI